MRVVLSPSSQQVQIEQSVAVEIKIEDVTNLYTLPRSARHRERGISLSIKK